VTLWAGGRFSSSSVATDADEDLVDTLKLRSWPWYLGPSLSDEAGLNAPPSCRGYVMCWFLVCPMDSFVCCCKGAMQKDSTAVRCKNKEVLEGELWLVD
jgi:hypothetical protein